MDGSVGEVGEPEREHAGEDKQSNESANDVGNGAAVAGKFQIEKTAGDTGPDADRAEEGADAELNHNGQDSGEIIHGNEGLSAVV